MGLEYSITAVRRKRSGGSIVKIILVIVLVLAILSSGLLIGGCFYMVSAMANHRVEKLEATPDTFKLPGENVQTTSKDGIALKAWYIRHDQPKGVVILLHGMDGMDASSMLGHGKFLYDAGYSSVALDMRAHGRSGGNRIAFAYEEPQDVEAVLDWMKERHELKDIPVALLGLSMGGATAIRTAAARPDVDAVISISSYATLEEMSEDYMRIMGAPEILIRLSMPVLKWIYGFTYHVDPANASPLHDISKIAPRPLLLAHGTADSQTAIKHARQLRDAAGKNTELWEEESADHCILTGDGTGAEDGEYRTKITSFLDRSLGQ